MSTETFTLGTTLPILLIENSDTIPCNKRHTSLKLNQAHPEPIDKSLVSLLPLEILFIIFKFIFNSCENNSSGLNSLLECSRVNRSWFHACMPLLYHYIYTSKVIPRIQLFDTNSCIDWPLVCFLSKVALNSQRWAIGPLRLFWLDDALNLRKWMSKYPNPAHPAWESLFSCTLDVNDMYHQFTVHSTFINENHPFLMLKFSEKMDLGSFLLMYKIKGQWTLFRIKPIGNQKLNSNERGNGGLVIWDTIVYGTCSSCKCSLERMQVCSDCKVAQYCSREWYEHEQVK